ncbi:MAG: SDR family oxidoreductase, partial [Gammaproteobacteria bacterium]|nr:SDR family oxidoreductase [Gammaproteobacteria bacterium]
SKLAYSGIVGYAAAKGAVEGITRSIAGHCLESGYKIRCNSIHPGSIDTPMVRNVGRQLEEAGLVAPDEAQVPGPAEMPVLGVAGNIADVVVFLASDESAFITAQEFVVDGGMSMLPAPLLHEIQ